MFKAVSLILLVSFFMRYGPTPHWCIKTLYVSEVDTPSKSERITFKSDSEDYYHQPNKFFTSRKFKVIKHLKGWEDGMLDYEFNLMLDSLKNLGAKDPYPDFLLNSDLDADYHTFFGIGEGYKYSMRKMLIDSTDNMLILEKIMKSNLKEFSIKPQDNVGFNKNRVNLYSNKSLKDLVEDRLRAGK